jgi:putative ABC transport system permease protein
MAIGQGTDTTYGIEPGDQVYIRVDDKERLVEVNGLLYDPVVQPPSFGGPAQFYTTRDRFGHLTGDRDFNRILAAAPEYDEEQVTRIADQMQRKLEKQEVESGGAAPNGGRVSDPSKHFFQDVMDGIFLVLGIMAGVALILGLFLVYNTINAIISQQVEQIGIMKAIGAKTWQILEIYFLNVLAYGLLALLIAVPLGMVGGWQLNVFLLNAFNAEPGAFSVPPVAIVAQVAIALLTPLLISLIPIFSGARITVREAISTYGLGTGTGLLERLLAKSHRIPRLFSLTMSNTFRSKGRVFLTQISLILSGLIFMMVMSVGDSVSYTFSDFIFSILRFNVNFVFEDPERINQVEALTLAHPTVEAVEMWGLDSGSIRPAGQPETDDDESVVAFGVPLPTTLYGYQLRAGRWLLPEDEKAIVLNQQLAEDVGVGVGDWVTIDHGLKGETTWQVVGLLFDPIITSSAHVPRTAMLQELNSVGRTSSVWIQTVGEDPILEVAAARELRQLYEDHQLDISPRGVFGETTASEITANVMGQFAVIITLLATMAVVIGVVGSIALSGTLSLNVMERRREIGVMRAIGASSGTIARLFIGEGLILGWLSWLIALPLSIPAGRLMTQALGAALQGEILYNYTFTGAIYWLIIITVLSVLASWFPARGATRISVRESLAYQ